jgi:hypothetical protein
MAKNKGIGIVVGLDSVMVNNTKKDMAQLIKDLKEIVVKNPIEIKFDNAKLDLVMDGLKEIQKQTQKMGADQLTKDLKNVVNVAKEFSEEMKNISKYTEVIDNKTGKTLKATTTVKPNDYTSNTNVVTDKKDTTSYSVDVEKMNKLEQQAEELANKEYNLKLEKEKELSTLFERNAILREQEEQKLKQQEAVNEYEQAVKNVIAIHDFKMKQRQIEREEITKDFKLQWEEEEKIKKQEEETAKQTEAQLKYEQSTRRKIAKDNESFADKTLSDLSKMEKELTKVENGFHSLKLLPNNKQDSINDIKQQINLLKQKASLADRSTDYSGTNNKGLTIMQQIEKLENSLANTITKDNKEYGKRLAFYDQLKSAQKQMYEYEVKLAKAQGDATKEYLGGKLTSATEEYTKLKSQFNSGSYNKDIAGDLSQTKIKYEQQLAEIEAKRLDTIKKISDQETKATQDGNYSQIKKDLTDEYNLKKQLLNAGELASEKIKEEISLLEQKNSVIRSSSASELTSEDRLTQEQAEQIKMLDQEFSKKLEIANLNKQDKGNSQTVGVGASIGEYIKGTLAVNAMYSAIQKLREGFSFIMDLNKDMTEVSIVTGQTGNEVKKLTNDYNQLAQQMSVTTSDIAKASVEFYRQGLGQEEVMQRMKTTTEYAKISNLDFKESAEILTATVNSMGISIDKASDTFAYLGRQNCPLI